MVVPQRVGRASNAAELSRKNALLTVVTDTIPHTPFMRLGVIFWARRAGQGGDEGWGLKKRITVVSLLWMLSAFTACFHMLAGLVVLDSFRGFPNCSPSVPDTSNAVVEEVDVEKRNIGGRREGKLRLITRKNPNGHFIIYVTATSIYTTYIYHGRQSRTQDGHPRITRALLK